MCATLWGEQFEEKMGKKPKPGIVIFCERGPHYSEAAHKGDREDF
jgi:hypothetical protein